MEYVESCSPAVLVITLLYASLVMKHDHMENIKVILIAVMQVLNTFSVADYEELTS